MGFCGSVRNTPMGDFLFCAMPRATCRMKLVYPKWTLLFATAAAACLAADAALPPRAAINPAKPAAKSLRIREGSPLLDVRGHFELTADGAAFFADDGVRLVALPNLALERIVATTREHPDRLQWIVSGNITEFRGANYLLITRGVLEHKRSGKPTRSPLAGGGSAPGSQPAEPTQL